MKRILFNCLVFFLGVVNLTAQSAQIKDFEKAIAGKTGQDFVSDALTLAGMYYDENLLDETIDWSDKAYDAAGKLNLKSQMAIALNLKGKALTKVQSKRNTYKNRAFKSFEESNSLTSDNNLRMDNLEHMKVLAQILNKKKDLESIEKDIALMKGEELRQEVTQLSQQQQQLKSKQENLESKMAQREVIIQNMTDEQMRRELLLSEKERMLDSLTFVNILDSLSLAQTEMLVKQQDAELREQAVELELRKSQRNFLIALAGLGLLVLAGLFHRYRTIRQHNAELAEKNRIIEEERKRSEELLLNILPVAVADELKQTGTAEARHYDQATVLFTDFKGFSEISKILNPNELVAALDYAFKNFDRIIGKYGLEKIKTIGDAYMCAGGLPGENGSHPVNVVQAALEIQQFLRNWNAERVGKGLPAFEARIGIHTGPLVAGVVGSKKFAYDIWGDTVNVASRMETSSDVGRVNISASTFHLVKDNFNCEYRGKVPAKNVGEVEMYYVEEEA
jgi:adenylate cyclase